MALEFFEEKEDNGTGELEFLGDWLKANPKNKQLEWEVLEIRAVKSGKGYILITDKFMIFLWKRLKVAAFLIQALDVWVNKEPDTGFALMAVIAPKSKDGYKLGVDKERKVTWFTMGNGFTTMAENAFSEDSDLNPFL